MRLGHGWGIEGQKEAEPLISKVTEKVSSEKGLAFSVTLYFNGFCQYEKIWGNREKRQLHSQLHSNYIQKMSVSTLPARAFASFKSIASYLLSNNTSDI